MAMHFGYFFQIPLPGFKPFVVFGPEANRKVLVTEQSKVRWRSPDPVTDLLQRGILVTDGEEHDRYRALMEPSLHPSRLDSYSQMILEKIKRVASGWQDGQIVDMLVESRKIALLVIMQVLFSHDAWNDLPHIWKPVLKAIEFISPGTWILWRKIPRRGYRKYLNTLDHYLYEVISKRHEAIQNNQFVSSLDNPSLIINDLLQHLIDANLDDNAIRDQMLTMLIAGHDTSTALLAWTFTLLGQHPDVHNQLVLALEQEGKPPLLDQVIKEALRLYPPIHIGNRMVAENIDLGNNNLIPAGARMFYSIYLTHRDPFIWENPDKFHPSRFERGRKTPPMSFIPFGGGARACIGAAFGQAEARLVLAYLLKNYQFKFLNAQRIRPHMGATLEPRPGVMTRVMRIQQG